MRDAPQPLAAAAPEEGELRPGAVVLPQPVTPVVRDPLQRPAAPRPTPRRPRRVPGDTEHRIDEFAHGARP